MSSVLKKRGTCYPVQYMGADGKRKTVKGYSDKAESRKLGERLEREAREIREGRVNPLANRYGVESTRAIVELVSEWETMLLAQNTTRKEARQKVARVRRLLKLAAVTTLATLTESRAMAGIKSLRQSAMSLQSCVHFKKAVSQFSKWLRRDRRVEEDPLGGWVLQGFNPKRDVRHGRRALTDEQCEKWLEYLEAGAVDVLKVSRKGKKVTRRIPAKDRLMWLLVVWGTGFRGKELCSLTRESFKLDSVETCVMLEAKSSKHRKQDRQPIAANLAGILRPWLATKRPGERVFKKFWKPNEIVHADLDAIGIPYCDQEGLYADFHAQRAKFITRLSEAGVSLEVNSKLARHSDPRVTMRYLKIAPGREVQAVESLPHLYKPTNGAAPALQIKDTTGHDGAPSGTTDESGPGAQYLEIEADNANSDPNSPMQLAGVEPATFGSVDRRSIQLS